MQSWGEAYRRLRQQHTFRSLFGQHGIIPGPNDFSYKAFSTVFSRVTGRTTPSDPSTAPIFGPQQVIFDKGAIVLGITSGAFQAQIPAPIIFDTVEPSNSSGRRDLYKLFFSYTDDQQLTVLSSSFAPLTGAAMNVQAMINANALMGEGVKDEFPRDLIVPPSTGFFVSAQSLLPNATPSGLNTYPPLFIHVVFHVVIPKE